MPNHKQIPVQVTVDVDEGIADMVRYLNTIPDVRTHTSCQGTIGEGGPKPYRAYVMAGYDSAAAKARIDAEFDTDYTIYAHTPESGYVHLHPKPGWVAPRPRHPDMGITCISQDADGKVSVKEIGYD